MGLRRVAKVQGRVFATLAYTTVGTGEVRPIPTRGEREECSETLRTVTSN